MMQAKKTFEGPKGQIKTGQIVDVNDKIAQSWERQGLAEIFTGQQKTLSNKMKDPDNQPNVASIPGQPENTGDNKNTENKSGENKSTEDDAKNSPVV